MGPELLVPRLRVVFFALLLGWGRLTAAAPARATLPPEIRAGRCDDLDAESLVQALTAELPQLLAPGSAPVPIQFGRVRMSLAEYARSTLQPLLLLARRGRAALCAALPRQFELHRLAAADRGLFSAYFHPLLRGSRTRHGPYQFPLYRRPEDAASQLTTAEILAGGLDGKSLELVYLTSLGTALNVHIEGSATVQLDDGTEINLTTDGNNGHPYTNPFKLARKDGVIPAESKPAEPAASARSPAPSASSSASDATSAAKPPSASAQTNSVESAPAPGRSRTRIFFDEHPDLLRTYWEKNPHFVFFKPTPLRGTGKFGELIAGRSVAVDAAQVPLGAALWMRTELASAAADQGASGALRHTPVARLALAQDTGAAIRGVGRVDVFVGSGSAAAIAAAFTSRPGELYLIVRRPAAHEKKRRPPVHVPLHAHAHAHSRPPPL